MKTLQTLRQRMISAYRHVATVNRRRIERRRTDSGYVLAIVLIICTVLAALSGEFITKSVTTMRITRQSRFAAQGKLCAETGFRFAETLLEADQKGLGSELTGKKSDSKTDSYHDLWAYEFPPVDVDGYSVRIRIDDEQSKINVNLLSVFSYQTQFYDMTRRMFEDMGFDPDYVDSLRDYVDTDDNKSPYGAETYDYYSRSDPPQKAKNAPLVTFNELFMVRLFDWQFVEGLRGGNIGNETLTVESNIERPALPTEDMPEEESNEKRTYGRERNRALRNYLRVYGNPDELSAPVNRININTASFRVLLALAPGMNENLVSEIMERRNAQPFSKIEEAEKLIPTFSEVKNLLTVSSTLYAIRIEVTSGNDRIVGNGVYDRTTRKYLYLKID